MSEREECCTRQSHAFCEIDRRSDSDVVAAVLAAFDERNQREKMARIPQTRKENSHRWADLSPGSTQRQLIAGSAA